MVAGLASKTIFFITTLFVTITVAIVFLNSIESSNSAISFQQNSLDNIFRTKIKIESFGYNQNANQVIIYVRNIGLTSLNINDLAIYFDTEKISSCQYFNISITDDSNTLNPRLWDPKEVIRIIFKKTLNNNMYKLLITTSNGVYDVVRTTPILTNTSFYLSSENTCMSVIPENPSCMNNEDCDDNNSYSLDYCIDYRCVYYPIECTVENECDDSDEYTLDYCIGNLCSYQTIECVYDIDCNDSNEYTVDSCNNNICDYTVLECIYNLDCNDSNEYTVDSCNNNICDYTVLECIYDIDCNDNNSSTKDTCEVNICYNTPIIEETGCSLNSDCNSGETCIYNECWSGAVGYWSFDSDDDITAYDSSPLGNDGSYLGNAVTTTGIKNNAIYMANYADMIEVPDDNSLDVSTATTVSMFINLDSSIAGSESLYMLRKIPNSWQNPYYISKLAWEGIEFEVYTSNGKFAIPWDWDAWHGRYLTNGRWYHIVGVYTGSEIKLYVDNIFDGSKPATGNIVASAQPLTFGSNFKGLIDEVVIFNRALNETEIEKLYLHGN